MNKPAIPPEVTHARAWSTAVIVRAEALAQSTRELTRNVNTPRYELTQGNLLNHLVFMRRLLHEGLAVMEAAIVSLPGDDKP